MGGKGKGGKSGKGPKPVCKFFGTPQGCANGNGCKFKHVSPMQQQLQGAGRGGAGHNQFGALMDVDMMDAPGGGGRGGRGRGQQQQQQQQQHQQHHPQQQQQPWGWGGQPQQQGGFGQGGFGQQPQGGFGQQQPQGGFGQPARGFGQPAAGFGAPQQGGFGPGGYAPQHQGGFGAPMGPPHRQPQQGGFGGHGGFQQAAVGPPPGVGLGGGGGGKKNVPCKFFEQGACRNGANCKFSHGGGGGGGRGGGGGGGGGFMQGGFGHQQHQQPQPQQQLFNAPPPIRQPADDGAWKAQLASLQLPDASTAAFTVAPALKPMERSALRTELTSSMGFLPSASVAAGVGPPAAAATTGSGAMSAFAAEVFEMGKIPTTPPPQEYC